MTAASRAWAGLAALWCVASGLALAVGHERLDWQPALALTQPWRAFTAVTVHYSALHLAANLAGALLVTVLGIVARVPWPSVAAWTLAWPLTQFGLLVAPSLLHYGGLSGVLHAGVAIAAVHVVAEGLPRQRWIGVAILAGLFGKVLLEAPWGVPLRRPPGWDIAVAPIAHASGVLWGLLCAGGAELWRRRPAAGADA